MTRRTMLAPILPNPIIASCMAILRYGRAAARSRSMALVTLSLSLKTADPATRTLAPAATASGAVATSTPPSTSRSHPVKQIDHLARTTDLRERRVEEMLMPESRVHRHDQHLVEVLHDFFQNGRRSRRVDGDADPFSQRLDALQGARQIVVAFPVDQKY